MNAILSHKPTTRPPVVLDTSDNPREEDGANENDDKQDEAASIETEDDQQPPQSPAPCSSTPKNLSKKLKMRKSKLS